MRTIIVSFAVILVVCVGYVGYAHFTGASVPTFGLPLGGERANVRARTLSFFEHVKFKNASALADFVAPNTSSDEVSHYLLKSLSINPDSTDLSMITIEQVELDTNETRARARVSLAGQDLNDKKPFMVSKIIFLYKTAQGNWLIDTKSIAQVQTD